MFRRGSPIRHNQYRQRVLRSAEGAYLVEALISVLIGSVLMAAVLNTVSTFFRYSTTTQNQILASNMAQQVIDNARNQQFSHLQALLGGANTKTEELSLYDYPMNPPSSLFPRPLIRNEAASSGMAFGQDTKNTHFNGQVFQTLTDNTPGNPNGSLTVAVRIVWSDQRGQHTYRTSTLISAHGIHN